MRKSPTAVEPRVRRLIAAHLGVDPSMVRPNADLQLDAVALRDVTRVLERTFAVALGDPEMARLRSCREMSLLISRRVAERDRGPFDTPPTPVWVRVIPTDPRCPLLERLVELTPYMVQTILEDARAPGHCRRLEIILGPTAAPALVARVEQLFASARAAGLTVDVHRAATGRAPRTTLPTRRKPPR